MKSTPRYVLGGTLWTGLSLVFLALGAPPIHAQTTPMVQAFTYYCQAEDFAGVVAAPGPGQWGRVSGTYFGGTAIQDGTTSPGQAVTHTFHVPASGTYYIWIAHLTDTNQFTTFDLVIAQGGSTLTNLTFAASKATATRDDTNYLYRPGSWEAWSVRAVALPAGAITLKLAHNTTATLAAVIDALQIVGVSTFTPDWEPTVSKPFSYFVEAETFGGVTNTPIVNGEYQWVSDYWNAYAGYASSGGMEILAWSVNGHPATHTFTVPKAGTYYFWTAHNTNPSYLIPESVVVEQNGSTVTNMVFGPHTPQNDQSDPDYHFQPGTWRALSVHSATLAAGPVTLKVYYNDPGIQSYGFWDWMQIVDDPNFSAQFPGNHYSDVPDIRFRVRPDSMAAPGGLGNSVFFTSYYYNLSVSLTTGVWSAWVDVTGAMKDAFYNMYYNSYSGHRWPFVMPFVVWPYSITNMTLSVEWECAPSIGSYTTTYLGPNFSLLLWRDSAAPLPHQAGPSSTFNQRYVDLVDSLNLSTNNLPKQFVLVDRFIGVDYEKPAWEEGLTMIRKMGMTAIDAGGYPQGKAMLTSLGIGKTASAVYIPPEIFDRVLTNTTDAVMDTWAQGQAATFQNQGWNPQDVAWFGMSDEPGWYYPYMFTAGPDLAGVFRTYLQNKGFAPGDFGKATWNDVNFLGRSGAVDLPSKRLFYWSMRFFPDNSADVFARWTRAMERAFYPGMIMPVNWNNFEGRYYTWGGIANNPTPNDPDAAFGSHDWIDFGRRRGTTTLWTEDWFSDSNAYIWSAYVSKLRSGTYRYNDSRTSNAPVAINFGGYVIGATAGAVPGGTLQKILSILGHGGKSIYFYIFGPEYTFPGNCYSENSAFVAELAKAMQVVGKAEDLLYPGTPVRAQVAIVTPQSSECWDTSYNGSDYMGETYNLYNALQDSHIPTDWVDEQDLEQGNLGQFRVLYITGPNLSAEAVTGLQQWIQSGGVAVFTAGAAQFDRYNEPATAINATLGIAAAPRSRLYWPAYTNGMGNVTSGVAGLSTFQTSGFAQSLAPTTASIQATFTASGQPAVTMNVVGSGRAIVFGTFVGTAYARCAQTNARGWVAWPVQLAGVTLPVDFNAPKVEAATLQSSGGLAVTLLNWTGTTVSNLALTVRSGQAIARVDSVKLGTSLPFTQNGQTVSVTLAALDSADVLKVYSTSGLTTNYPPGDVNGDSKVNGADALLINQVIISLRSNSNPVFAAAGYSNGDVNQSGTVTGGDPLLINQAIVGLRTYIVTRILPSSRSFSNNSTAVTIYGVGFPTNVIATATIGAPVNLTLSNVVVVNRERITAIMPAGGGSGTGTVHVVSSPTNSVTSFGRFINP